VTRISRGKIELQRSRNDARDLVRRACEDHRMLFQERNLSLRVETSDPAWIEADETRLAQVIGNLLHNAAKFSHAGGSVIVSAGAVHGQAEIRVHDEGVGIAPDLLPRVFEPFVQADGGLARTKGGLGLGLALVKGLVEMHGGVVSAQSEGVGRGSEFVVTLPLAAAPVQVEPLSVPRAHARGLKILVIEDNVDAAHSMAEVLEMEGHRVHVATDGRSGITKAQELRPEVILCDIGLPDVDGYQIARTLRAEKALCSARLIALSGYALPEDRRRAKDAGFDAHIAKPPALDILLAAVIADE
jgi:CheY-like chemotaxis protein